MRAELIALHGEEESASIANRIAERTSFLVFLTTRVPADEDRYVAAVEVLTCWLADHLSCAERVDLIDLLEDPSHEFTSEVAQRMKTACTGLPSNSDGPCGRLIGCADESMAPARVLFPRVDSRRL